MKKTIMGPIVTLFRRPTGRFEGISSVAFGENQAQQDFGRYENLYAMESSDEPFRAPGDWSGIFSHSEQMENLVGITKPFEYFDSNIAGKYDSGF
ncbi:MAG: hypothetical protein Unbinned1312contig1001_34 [Prokaryotic dsDNA virus sp.]|nr:MAG: hypothetical protein Unbinned1312contig1001_34 [Prokaryotic dsDNA virus sp.]